MDRQLFGLALKGSAALYLVKCKREVLLSATAANFQLGHQALLDPPATARVAEEEIGRFPASDTMR